MAWFAEKADAIGRKLAEAHASDLAASYSAMQAHKSLPPHEQHLARPDSLVHKMPPLNMTLYHEMMRFQPPNMQELYRGGGL